MPRDPVIPDRTNLLEAARQALAESSDGLDAAAVQPDTPLAALVFDSLAAVRFIATLESSLGVGELPFERWLAEHSESTEVLTVGTLVEWLLQLPQLAGGVSPRIGGEDR